ncbi:hypothetical protein OOT08_18035, partial [Leucobacter sp. M11]
MHRLDEQRVRARLLRSDDAPGGVELLCGELLPVEGVAAEVAAEHRGVALGAVRQDVEHAGEARDVLLAAAGHVDRVRDRGGGRQLAGDPVPQLRAELICVEPALREHVARDGRVPAAVGKHRDPVAARRDPGGERHEEIRDLGGGGDLLDARGLADGGDDRGRGGERPGVRAGVARGGVRAAHREQDEGFARLPGVQGRAGEAPAVPEVLAVDRDRAGVRVGDAGLDELRGVDVRLVPEAGEAGQAEPRGLQVPGDLERDVAALRDDGDVADGKGVRGQAHPGRVVHDPEAVWAEEPGPGGERPRRDAPLQRFALLPHFAHAPGDG